MTHPLYATFHDLHGQSVFITGGGSGIGMDLTEGFLEQGCKVAFVQRSDASEFVREMAARHGNRPLFITCDITDTDALKRSMDQAASAHGAISVLVNNAANDTRHGIEGFTRADWDQMIAVNLTPHFFSAQHAVPGMIAGGGGSIINYSSISYMMGNGGYAAYTAAKSGITGLTRSLARDLGKHRIRVNAVMPGWVLTTRQLDLWANPEALEAHLKKQCLPDKMFGRDMVGGTLFLASKASALMTGQALVIDAGVVVSG